MIYHLDGGIDLMRAFRAAATTPEAMVNRCASVTIRGELPNGRVVMLDVAQLIEGADGHIELYCHKIDLGEDHRNQVQPDAVQGTAPVNAAPTPEMVEAANRQQRVEAEIADRQKNDASFPYRLRSAMRRIEAVVDLLEETAMVAAKEQHEAVDLTGVLGRSHRNGGLCR